MKDNDEYALPHDKYTKLEDGQWSTFASGGMTLRDYFAGQVMDIILKKLYEMAERTGERYDNVYRIAFVASYEYADAMLEARK